VGELQNTFATKSAITGLEQLRAKKLPLLTSRIFEHACMEPVRNGWGYAALVALNELTLGVIARNPA